MFKNIQIDCASKPEEKDDRPEIRRRKSHAPEQKEEIQPKSEEKSNFIASNCSILHCALKQL